MSLRTQPKADRANIAIDLELLRDVLEGLEWGQVAITVHDGAITVVTRTETLFPRCTTLDDR